MSTSSTASGGTAGVGIRAAVPADVQAALAESLTPGGDTSLIDSRMYNPDWARIYEDAERRVYARAAGGVLEVSLDRQGQIVGHVLHQGDDAWQAYLRYGYTIHPNDARRIDEQIVAGQPLAEAIRGFGRAVELGRRPSPEGGSDVFVVLSRSGLLVVRVDAEGVILSHRRLEGAEAAAAYELFR